MTGAKRVALPHKNLQYLSQNLLLIRCTSELRIRGATGIGTRLGDAQSDLRQTFDPLSA